MNNAAGTPGSSNQGAQYLQQYKVGMGYPSKAKYWAWHAYSDGEDAVSRSGTARWRRFRHFLNATNYSQHPAVWLTEQGVVLHTDTDHIASMSPNYANRIMRAYVSDSSSLTRVSTRTTRFFYYQWRGEARPNQDSGLISYVTNNTRDVYDIYKAVTNP